MKDTDLYKGFGEIDDELIEKAEAVSSEHGADASMKVIERKEIKVKKIKAWNWGKIVKFGGTAVAACLVIGLAGSFLFHGMGAKASFESASSTMSYNGRKEAAVPTEAPMAAEEAYDMEYDTMAVADSGYGAVNGYKDESSDIAIKNKAVSNKNVKLIYTANLELQTLEYEETEAQLYEMVEKFGGYVENTYRNNGGMYYQDYNQDGNYTFRIPQEHYADFINGLGDNCHVVSVNQSVEDVTLQYSDIEKRLATLETKYDRLLELLSKADNMADIIDLENAISECEYQIDNYTSTKTRYDSLVSYSTVSVYLYEVERLEDPVEVDNSFFARLGRNFKNGFENALDNLLDFFYWFAYNIIGIVIFAVIDHVADKTLFDEVLLLLAILESCALQFNTSFWEIGFWPAIVRLLEIQIFNHLAKFSLVSRRQLHDFILCGELTQTMIKQVSAILEN